MYIFYMLSIHCAFDEHVGTTHVFVAQSLVSYKHQRTQINHMSPYMYVWCGRLVVVALHQTLARMMCNCAWVHCIRALHCLQQSLIHLSWTRWLLATSHWAVDTFSFCTIEFIDGSMTYISSLVECTSTDLLICRPLASRTQYGDLIWKERKWFVP